MIDDTTTTTKDFTADELVARNDALSERVEAELNDLRKDLERLDREREEILRRAAS